MAARYGVRLSRAGLPVCKHSAVASVKRVSDEVFDLREDCLVALVFAEDASEFEITVLAER